MKNFLKFICVFATLILLCGTTAAAEGSINSSEQAVLEKIQTVYKAGTREYTVPGEYVNQARNFFLTIDLSKSQSDEILGYINEGISVLDSQVQKFGSGDVDFEKFDSAAKSQILELGQKAAQVVNLKLVYSGSGVTITDAEGTPVFSGAAVIKITGGDNKQLVFGIVSFSVIAVTYAICLWAFRKQKSHE